MNTLKQKLSSRKLWTALAGIVVGLAAAFGLPENDIAQIAGIVTSAAAVVSYIFAEGKIDAERAANSAPINITIDAMDGMDGADINDGKLKEELPMKEDLRQATDAVMRLNAKGEKEFYIDKCDLTPMQAEILKRRHGQKQSLIQISMEMHLSKECVQKHYRTGMLILKDILDRCGR